MSANVSAKSHDGMLHAIESVGCDIGYILDLDVLYKWLSEDEREILKNTLSVLSDLESR